MLLRPNIGLAPQNQFVHGSDPVLVAVQRGFDLTQTQIVELINNRPRLGLAHDRQAQRYSSVLVRNPKDAVAQRIFREIVQQHILKAALNDDPFMENYIPSGGISYPYQFIELGRQPNGMPIGLIVNQITGNVIVVGRTGLGKSSLVANLLVSLQVSPLLAQQDARVICFVCKKELRHLATLPHMEDSLVIEHTEICHSLFQPPKGISLEQWLVVITNTFAQSFGIVSAHRLLMDVLSPLCKSLPNDTYPTLSQVIETVEKISPKFNSREAQYKESILYSLKNLRASVGDIFEYTHSNFLDRLFAEPGLCIIETSTSDTHASFLLAVFLNYIYTERQKSEKTAPFVFFLIDDATQGVLRSRDHASPTGASVVAQHCMMGRALGLGLITVVHVLSEISPLIRDNCSVFITCGLPGEDPRIINQVFMVNAEQTQKIRTLQPGEMVLINSALWPKAVYGTFDKVNLQGQLSEEARKRILEKFMTGVTAKKIIPPTAIVEIPNQKVPSASQPKPFLTLTDNQAQFLMCIVSGPPKTVAQLCEQLNLTRTQVRRIAKPLENKGIITPHKFSTGKRGGQLTYYCIEGSGWRWLESKGLAERPKPLTNGGFEHELAARLIEIWGKKKEYKASFETVYPGVRADVLLTHKKTGERIISNIGISNPEREVDALLRLKKCDETQGSKIILVTRDSTFARRVRTIIKSTGNAQALPEVEVKLLADYANL